MPLLQELKKFRQNVSTYQQYIIRAFTQDQFGDYLLTGYEQSFVVESAFLKIFIAWESFLESTFLLYLMGNFSAGGKQATRFAMPQSKRQAREMLIGTQRYIDWANPEIIRKLSKIYFDNGEPINSIVSSINSELLDLRTIRNAAAHLSSTTVTGFQGVVRRRLGGLPTGISVSDFLLSLDPSQPGNSTIFNEYILLLDAASENIVWWN